MEDVRNFGMQDFDHCGEFQGNKKKALVINPITADQNEFPFLANRVSQASENTGGADKVPDHGYVHSFSSARSCQLWTGTQVISECSFEVLVLSLSSKSIKQHQLCTSEAAMPLTVVQCAVRLVFLGPQLSVNLAETASQAEGPG